MQISPIIGVSRVADKEDGAIDLFLASASPRRRDLLNQVGIRFEVISSLAIDESVNFSESPDSYVRRLAEKKARAGFAVIASSEQVGSLLSVPVLGADTCIAIDDEILGKPEGRQDGFNMLHRLSGRSHQVLTAICLYDGQIANTALSISRVTFKSLGQTEIESYWDTGEPFDKAGAYAIQGFAAQFIADLQGSYSGVVGLPLYELRGLLEGSEKQRNQEKQKRA